MTNEELANKVFRVKTGEQFYKVFFWRGEWYRLTGLFGRSGGKVVAQAFAEKHGYTWGDEDGNFLSDGAPVRGLWQEIVPGVTNQPWG